MKATIFLAIGALCIGRAEDHLPWTMFYLCPGVPDRGCCLLFSSSSLHFRPPSEVSHSIFCQCSTNLLRLLWNTCFASLAHACRAYLHEMGRCLVDNVVTNFAEGKVDASIMRQHQLWVNDFIRIDIPWLNISDVVLSHILTWTVVTSVLFTFYSGFNFEAFFWTHFD